MHYIWNPEKCTLFPMQSQAEQEFHTGKQQIETFCGFWKNKLQEHWCIEMTFEKRGKMFCHYQKITNLKIKNFLFCLCYPMPVCMQRISFTSRPEDRKEVSIMTQRKGEKNEKPVKMAKKTVLI